MPEYIIGVALSIILAACGWTLSRIGKNGDHIDHLEITLVRDYTSKDELERVEDKVDLVLMNQGVLLTPTLNRKPNAKPSKADPDQPPHQSEGSSTADRSTGKTGQPDGQ